MLHGVAVVVEVIEVEEEALVVALVLVLEVVDSASGESSGNGS